MGYPYRDKSYDLKSSLPKSTWEVNASTQGCYIIHDDILIMYYPIIFFSATLAGDDVARLVRDNSGKSINSMAIFLRNHLVNTYPTQYWVVTVYRDVTGYDKHAFIGASSRISYKFRHHGFNYVVTRYPKHSARSPGVSISSVVGSITGDDAKRVRDSIKSKFQARGLTYTSIHVVKRRWKGWWWDTYGMTLTTSPNILSRNYFWREFSNVIVIVVAPY